MLKATIVKDRNSPHIRYTVTGNVTEGIGETLYEALREVRGEVELDLSRVTITNSLGIKEWMQARDKLPAVKIKLSNCPTSIVHTINMIPRFIETDEVASVIGVFVCENCESTRNHIIKIGEDITSDDLSLKVRLSCENCGHSDMELEVPVEEFFEFLEEG